MKHIIYRVVSWLMGGTLERLAEALGGDDE
jgi:hypothetical protein